MHWGIYFFEKKDGIVTAGIRLIIDSLNHGDLETKHPTPSTITSYNTILLFLRMVN